MAGRAVLYALGNTLEDAFHNAPRAYRLVLPHARVKVEVGKGRGRIELRDVYNFASSYHYGVFEGTIAEHGFQPRLTLTAFGRLGDADYDVVWG
jgi:uncharacterized protein (TIGR02265 family)